MTTEHTLIAALSTLLIAGLLIYLQYKFQWLEFDKRWKEWVNSGTALEEGWPTFHADLRAVSQ